MTRITTDTLITGSGRVTDALTMGFGKYAERSQTWVAQHDPDYFLWAHENVGHFSAMPQALSDARDRVISADSRDDDDEEIDYGCGRYGFDE